MAMSPEQELAQLEAEDAAAELAKLEAEDAQLKSQAAMAGIEGAINASPYGAALMEYAPDVAGMGLEAGLTMAGQAAGANPLLVRATRGASIPIGGAIGAGLGYEAARRVEGRPFELGRFATTVGMGAIPSAPVATQAAKQLVGSGAVQGAINVGLGNAQSLIDRGKLLSPGEDAIQFGTGLVSPALAKTIGKAFGGKAVKAPLTEQEQMANEAKRIFSAARKKGLKIAPAELGGAGGIETYISGKDTTDNLVSSQNAGKFQKIAREDIGLPATSGPITDIEIKTQRETFEAPFEAAKKVSPEARDMVDSITLNRAKANRLYGQVKANAPGAHEQYLAVKDEVRAAEDLLEGELIDAGKKDLAAAIKESRVKLAKLGAIQDTFNKSTGIVDPVDLAALYNIDRNENSLTGGLKLIADFTNSFKNSAKPVGFSPINQIKGSTHYAATQASGGSGRGLFAAFLENTAGKAVRPMMLREVRQKRFLLPRYQAEVVGDPAARFTRFGLNALSREQAASQ